MNRRLDWMPRFHARLPWDRLLVQGMLHATQTVMFSTAADVSVATRSESWGGHRFRLRVIEPKEPSRGVYVDFHGGGWAVGNARMDDPVNARIAERCGLTVVSVDYELIPRSRMPDIIDQCAAAASWVFEHAEAEFGARDIFIGGESAGAHLAACTTLRLRDAQADFRRLKGVVLFYGAFDLAGTASARAAGPDTLVLHGPSIRTGLQKLTPDMTDEAAPGSRAVAALRRPVGTAAGAPPRRHARSAARRFQDPRRALAGGERQCRAGGRAGGAARLQPARHEDGPPHQRLCAPLARRAAGRGPGARGGGVGPAARRANRPQSSNLMPWASGRAPE